MKQHQSKELASPLIDSLAFLGKAITDMKQFRRNNLKPRLPEKLKPFSYFFLILLIGIHSMQS